MLSLEKREKFPKFEFISSLSYSWIFIIKLYMEKKISKFDFISSRNFRNFVLSRHCAGEKEEIQVYVVTGEKERI